MSQESVIEELQRLGMSGYEAKAYVALVASGVPLNGYEVAKRSSVPRSTVYETLAKLVGRGAAYEVRDGEAGVGYLPLPPSALLDRMRRDFDRSIDLLANELPQVASPPESRLVHSLDDRASLLARARDVVSAAGEVLFLSGWPRELDELKPLARQAEADGVDVSVVVFGEDPEPVGWTTLHRWSSSQAVEENHGARLLVVSADRTQAVMGAVVGEGEDAYGIYADDPAVVLVAVEYVRHDIAMHLVADKFGPDFATFWNSDPVLARMRALKAVPEALRSPRRGSIPPRRGRRGS